MIQFDLELQLNELLTVFFQNFKNTFAAKMSLIESICLNSNSLQNNPQFLLSKLSTKVFKFEWSIDPYSMPITHEMISNFQRFYLRIQEYLQFRLNGLASLHDKNFSKEMELFHNNLHKTISSLQSQVDLFITVWQFLFQINKCEKAFTSKLIELLSNRSISFGKGPLDYESLSDIKSFIQSKICKQQFQMFKEKQKVISICLPPSRQKRISLRPREEELSKIKYLMRKKKASKGEATRQSLPPRNSILFSKDPNLEHNHWDSKLVIPEDETLELQSYLQNQNITKLQVAYDILDLETFKFKSNRQEIYSELEGKNAKNRTHIESFIHKYERKHRRSLRRQKSEKQSKYSVKSSKLPSKGEEKNVFSMKLETSQRLCLPSSKGNYQNTKKYEQFELPLILSRNNRRTTVEK